MAGWRKKCSDYHYCGAYLRKHSRGEREELGVGGAGSYEGVCYGWLLYGVKAEAVCVREVCVCGVCVWWCDGG